MEQILGACWLHLRVACCSIGIAMAAPVRCYHRFIAMLEGIEVDKDYLAELTAQVIATMLRRGMRRATETGLVHPCADVEGEIVIEDIALLRDVMLGERDQLTDLDKQILFEATVFLGPDRVEEIQDVAYGEVLEELAGQCVASAARQSA